MLVPKKKDQFEDKNLNLIDAPWIIECIEEKFENAVSMLKDNCIIYGGALRDLLAGKEIGGDLDIIVPLESYSVVATSFISSFRWIENDLFQARSLGYEKSIIEQTHTFMNLNKDLVQLISPDNRSETGVTNQGFDKGALKIVEQVDIRCCGVLSDVYGNIYEVLPGAYEDCINRELNLNEGVKINSERALKERIKKLEKRGWKNNINIFNVTKS